MRKNVTCPSQEHFVFFRLIFVCSPSERHCGNLRLKSKPTKKAEVCQFLRALLEKRVGTLCPARKGEEV